MTSTATWLRDFLSKRNLPKPDSRPLFEYRTSEAELAELRTRVAVAQLSTTHDRGAFCLYAAEWWRRHGEGLTFNGLLESLGWDCSYTELYPEIEQGLRYWGRELRVVRGPARSRRDFVGSLSREGGLPLQLLLGSQTSIRRFFRELLRVQSAGVEVNATWAELAAVELPKAWRHPDIYELAAGLVTHIWQLRASVANAERPVIELDRTQPGWQSRLPILVDSEIAEALVRGLVEDAQQIATSGRLGLTVETRLVARNGEWSIGRILEPPRRMKAHEMWKLLDLNPNAEGNPRRVRLLVDDGSGPRPIAVATQWKADEPFELLPLVDGALMSSSTTELVVLADTVAESFASKLLRGGERLDPGPWVFIPDGPEGADEWKLIAQGSARVRSTNVLVALPPSVVAPVEGTQPHGQLITSKGVRALVRVSSGRVQISDPKSGQRYSVEASAAEDDLRSYRFEGTLFGEELRPPVWRGLPRVYEEPVFGVRRQVHPRDLEWRPRHGGHTTWERLSDACRGHVEIRLRSGQTTLFARSALVVPETSSFEIRPTTATDTAELLLEGTQASRGLLVPAPGFAAVPHADTGRLAWSVTSGDDAPARVRVELHWTQSRSMKLWLPFPKVGVRFIDSAGRVLPNNATVAVERLAGCRVETLLPRQEPHPMVEATLRSAPDRREFGRESNFAHKLRLSSNSGAQPIRRFTLDLSRLVEDVSLRLASTTELNAFVELQIETRAGMTRLNVRRFPLAMMVSADRSDVLVLPDKSETFVDDLVAKMSVHRIPIQQPNAEPVLMQRSTAGWAMGPLEDNSETWLVIGTEAGRCCARPVIWHRPGDSGPAPENLDSISTLPEAVRLGWKHLRLAAIGKILDDLITDSSHPEWDQLTPFLSSLATLPATTYDVLDVVVQKPTLCVYTLVELSPSVGIQPLWTALEQLSFAWELVPVEAWLAGFRLWWTRTEAKVIEFDEGVQSIVIEAARTQIRGTLNAIEARLRGFTIVRELIASRLLGAEPGRYMRLVSFAGGVGRKALLDGRDEAQMDLFRTHADDRSWPSFQATRDLVDQFSDEIPGVLQPLGSFTNNIREKTRFVTYAPVQAAIAAVCGLQLNPEQVFALRQLEAFDNTWFDHCYEATLAVAIGIILEADPHAFK